ncbi:probable tRNA (uracil-O(2)-)-methyltransferase [Gigantopelta aegis]|uniref:probable tRNA (uracil-O(2)-)-methyltransferase n=1 Tax=Gigantopelta aegis TaxID=1735272 RepID=UPI001B88C4FB|nr:probable tRNA (uracil-O(2)-)-methyltransferase [Gigantopelta aegis]
MCDLVCSKDGNDSRKLQDGLHSHIFTLGDKIGFMKALSVYINKPHVVNRRLCGAKMLFCERFDSFNETLLKLKKSEWRNNSCTEKGPLNVNLASCLSSNITEAQDHFQVVVRDLLPKQSDKFPTLRELIVCDYQKCSVTFHPVCHSNCNTDTENLTSDMNNELIYGFVYSTPDTQPSIHLKLSHDSEERSQCHVTGQWLKDVLLPKLRSWSEESALNTDVTSLKLVPIDEYNSTYSRLKASYGLHFVKVWPENTDPRKFVYEDIAIAAYLLLIWKEERATLATDTLQSFVDLGCGNGLLVHILTSEGHPGLGIDLRRRKIWDIYGEETKLEVKSISPSADTLFPQYDWLIGNHSDELTPWIPLIAARSSYQCRYFVLPCCHHDFDRKFNKRERGTSQYRTYLNFVKEVGEKCGFKVKEDTLRIPSTKRVCFIGQERAYSEEEEEVVDIQRSEYVKSHCSKSTESNISVNTQRDSISHNSSDDTSVKHGGLEVTTNSWSTSFQPRSSTELVRNCQKVARETKELIVQAVFQKVLEAPEAESVQCEGGTSWNRGGCVPLAVVAEMFDQDVLQQLKSECGGLQTLLRNHNNIFQVSGGAVRLRDFSSENPWSTAKRRKRNVESLDSGNNLKTVLCWFHTNHPDGCPRSAVKCRFAHGTLELRERPKKNKSQD